jgi:hypothetical protein
VKKFFWVYGLAVLSLLAVAEFRGWSLTSYDEVKGVPKSLRDNPGSYRSTYSRLVHK